MDAPSGGCHVIFIFFKLIIILINNKSTAKEEVEVINIACRIVRLLYLTIVGYSRILAL